MEDTDTTAAAADADTGTGATAAAAAAEAPSAADEPPPSSSSPSSSSSAPSAPPPNPDPTTTPPVILDGVLTLALPAPNAPPPVAPPISLSSAAARRIPPPCWTHEETLALIDAYGAKWAALRRGNLRTAHWEEVAGDLQARTADLPGAKPKTAMQCRHKMEKLRKRYRAERQRSLKAKPGAPSKSSWVYFRRMDALEFGAGPKPGLALARRPPQREGSDEEDRSPSESEGEDEEEGGDDAAGGRNLPGIRDPIPRANGIGNGPSPLRIRIPRATRTNRTVGVSNEGAAAARPARSRFPSLPSISSNGRTRFLGKFPGSRLSFLHDETNNHRWEGNNAGRNNKKRKRAREEEEEEETEPVRGSTSSILEKVVAAVRMLGDGFMRMEQMKMDMAREFERARMDMELKHTEMMLQSQRRILDFMIKGITGSKKKKMPPEA